MGEIESVWGDELVLTFVVRLLLYQLQIPLRSLNDQFKVNLYNKG